MYVCIYNYLYYINIIYVLKQWVNEKQSEFNCNAMQLLYYQAPLSATCVAVIIPFFEPVFSEGGIFGTHWSLEGIVCITHYYNFY